MKMDKKFILGTIGYSIIASYWILVLIFCIIMLVIHWIDYSTIGETMSFKVLVFCTVAVPIAWIMTGLGIYTYIHNYKNV